MKIMTILGSPKKKGNTAKVLGMFEEIVSTGHEVDRINIIDYDVKGCLGCGKCQQKPDEPGCVQKDDAMDLFDRMMKADAVVYASPLYCWSFTSQIKPLIDRHFCLVTGYGTPEYKALLDGLPVALLVTCGGPVEENTEHIQGIFEGISAYGKCKTVGKYILPFCTVPDAIGEEGRRLAEKMATEIEC